MMWSHAPFRTFRRLLGKEWGKSIKGRYKTRRRSSKGKRGKSIKGRYEGRRSKVVKTEKIEMHGVDTVETKQIQRTKW